MIDGNLLMISVLLFHADSLSELTERQFFSGTALIPSQTNLKYLGSFHVLTPVSWQMSLSQKKMSHSFTVKCVTLD